MHGMLYLLSVQSSMASRNSVQKWDNVISLLFVQLLILLHCHTVLTLIVMTV